ncbi:hypothetical protein BH10PSE19_BH10PSE19_00250 [soil metagenome]
MIEQKKNNNFITLYDFKNIIIKKLEESGITVSELARRTNIGQSTLHKGLFGDRELTFSNVSAICDALELPFLMHHQASDTLSIPVIHNLEQLDWLDHVNQCIWDEYIIIESSLGRHCVAVDSSLFEYNIFPSMSILIIDRKNFDKKNMIYIKNNTLSLCNDDNSILGKLIKVSFRGTK